MADTRNWKKEQPCLGSGSGLSPALRSQASAPHRACLTSPAESVSLAAYSNPRRVSMKKYAISTLALLMFFALQAFAQEHYTEGPVWQVTLIRVKPNHMDAYLSSLRQGTKPLFDEMKKEGLILDYKVFLNTTKHDPDDWDVSVALQYKNFAALDGLTTKNEAIRDKILGSKQAAQLLGEKRSEMRERVTTMTF